MVAVKSDVVVSFDKIPHMIRKITSAGRLVELLEVGADTILESAQDGLELQGLVDTYALYDSGHTEIVNANRVDVVFDKVYSAIHEYGGTIDVPVTQKSRGYFFFQYDITGDEKWLFMALSRKDVFKVVIPARPYMRPAMEGRNLEYAIDQIVDKAIEIIESV